MQNRSSKPPKRPRDLNQLAAQIVAEATGATAPTVYFAQSETEKNLHAVELGRLGGQKGGKARAKKLSPARRSEIAKNAARARWKRREKD